MASSLTAIADFLKRLRGERTEAHGITADLPGFMEALGASQSRNEEGGRGSTLLTSRPVSYGGAFDFKVRTPGLAGTSPFHAKRRLRSVSHEAPETALMEREKDKTRAMARSFVPYNPVTDPLPTVDQVTAFRRGRSRQPSLATSLASARYSPEARRRRVTDPAGSQRPRSGRSR